MNYKKLAKIKVELSELRSNPIGIKPRKLIRLALQLKRVRKLGSPMNRRMSASSTRPSIRRYQSLRTQCSSDELL
ncbi:MULTISPECIES: hypothetical protein [unclassified Methylibium]|uniref:hypothetical protein n=1 Tax=unclassified Methylibium TaxID=2633235 RepID=UPI00126800F8|nr:MULTISPECIES: hypothetical protein [unclassified Methylibium]